MAVSRGRICCFVLLPVVIIAVVITVVTILFRHKEGLVTSPGVYLHAAVAADAGPCSEIGRNILQQGGSAVDGAIAALLCVSIMNPQSMGIGGGVIFTIYNASTGTTEVINARETAPQNVERNLLQNCGRTFSFKTGTQWIAVPGELRGYQQAHQRHGRLPWKSLFDPTIKLATDGFPVPKLLADLLNHKLLQNVAKLNLCPQFCKDREVLKEGELLRYQQLADTLRTIAEKGADAFYEGRLAEQMVEDLRSQGGNLTVEDFRNYTAEVVKPINISVGDYTMFSPPPPAGGAILSFILNILKGYNFNSESVKETDNQVQTYHRIIEAFKFGNGQKFRIKDPLFNTEVAADLLSESFADKARKQIDDLRTYPLQYYSSIPPAGDGVGTSHISVIAEDGSAVSVTSTINHIFGSMIFSSKTGVLFNNELADFCKVTGTSDSSIHPGERPPSAMTPTILISKDKLSTMVIGAAGGDMIITATAQAIMNKLWFGYDLRKAIASLRFYVNQKNEVQTDREEMEQESASMKEIERRLKSMGHNFTTGFFPSVVQGVFKGRDTIWAVSDARKHGKADGY